MVILPLFSTVSSAFNSRALQSDQARKGRESERESWERESLERESEAQIPLFAIVIPVPFQRTHLIFLNFLGTGRFVIIIWVLSISIYFRVSAFSLQILSLFLFSPFLNRIFKDPLCLSCNSAKWVCFSKGSFSFFIVREWEKNWFLSGFWCDCWFIFWGNDVDLKCVVMK